MHKKMIGMSVMVLALGWGLACNAAAANDQEILDAVRKEIRSQSMASGTLDIYDPGIDAVRNLRTMEFPTEVTIGGDGRFTALIKFRDVNSGAVVDIEAVAQQQDGTVQVEDLKITGVQELDKGEDLSTKEYTDQEIQDFMKRYLAQQMQFTGSIMLYDEDRGVMRKIKLLELDPEVRRMGIFYNSRGQFEDLDSGDILGIDVAVQNEDGNLGVQALRIRDRKKGPVKAAQP